MKKEILVMKDVKFLGQQCAIELQWSKRLVDENDTVLDKENQRCAISLDGIDGSDATETFKKYIPLIVLEQAKKIGELESLVGNISKECAHKVSIAQKEASDKMILHTELLNAKDALKAHEDNLTMAKEINDEIYAENKRLKEEKEALLKDMVMLDENIVSLNTEILRLKVELKKAK